MIAMLLAIALIGLAGANALLNGHVVEGVLLLIISTGMAVALNSVTKVTPDT